VQCKCSTSEGGLGVVQVSSVPLPVKAVTHCAQLTSIGLSVNHVSMHSAVYSKSEYFGMFLMEQLLKLALKMEF